MVSIMNFYIFRDELRRRIFERKNSVDVYQHPTDWGWITYALSCNGKENNPLFNEVLNNLENWTLSENAGKQERHLAPLSIYSYLTANKEVNSKIIEKIISILNKVLAKEITKFSPLNDPEQVFCITLISEYIPDDQRDMLKVIVSKINNGRLLRRILYTASLLELGYDIREFPSLEDNEHIEDLITLLWFYERYKDKHSYELTPLWKSFNNIKSMINLTSTSEGEGLITISNRSIALLYEALVIETQVPDPNILFDIYPFHKRVRQIVKKHFKEKSYSVAVEQATKVLNEIIQKKSGISNKSEAELVQSTMKSISRPGDLKIKFNKYLNRDSGKNEQVGLALIAEGIFKAFRNPRGHEPEDHPLIKIMNPYEILAQLIIISYLIERIEKAD